MRYRMYFFVPYNISDIQKGIQAGHCALEYAVLYGSTEEFSSFMKNDKTWIILNGGSTRNFHFEDDEFGGDINKTVFSLGLLTGVRVAHFNEPDLNDALTAFCFLADERVWDLESYPDFGDIQSIGHQYLLPKTEEEWVSWVGGRDNVYLRNLIKDKRLA